ncbi:MAG: fatty acid desaturase, partial [Phycisphaerales bacterium]|nr:fatty acid desaturase [Phycisphaerales bacterium]
EIVMGRNWLAEIPPEKRTALRRLHDINVSNSWIAAFFPVMWAAAAVVVMAFPYFLVRLAGYVVIGTAIHGMAVLTHEASHFSMFRNRRLDRWVGFLMGAPVFVSHTAYRVLHGYHHRYTREEEDPDEFNNVTKNRFLLSLLFYSWLVIGTPVYLIHVVATAMIRGTRRDRLDVLVEYAILIGLFGGTYALARHFGRTDLIVHCWAVPMIVAMVFGNVRSWAEHAMTIPGSPMTCTRTVTSNRIVSLLMCNLNYHLEHHLCPGIPWYNLPKMHALMHEEFRRAGAFVYRSYLRFLWDALRTGVHGIASMHMPSM